MRKKFLLCLAALLALWGIGTTAAAAPAPKREVVTKVLK